MGTEFCKGMPDDVTAGAAVFRAVAKVGNSGGGASTIYLHDYPRESPRVMSINVTFSAVLSLWHMLRGRWPGDQLRAMKREARAAAPDGTRLVFHRQWRLLP